MSASNPPPPTSRDAGNLDLSALQANNDLKLSVEPQEHADDRAHRIAQDRHDANLRRAKDTATFVIGWLVVIFIAYRASAVAFDNAPEAATLASWGRTILGSLIGGFAGYVVGRKT